METLKNHKLLIDAECPMCRLYGNAFEANGLVEKGTCYPYQTAELSIANLVDMARAKNEIAFINTQNNQVVYGIDAFKTILLHLAPFFEKIMNNKIIDWLLRKLYRFVSTNRKVIIPGEASGNDTNDCNPTLNIPYRILYILLIAFFSSSIIYNYSMPINKLMGWQSSIYRELIICFGQIFWQVLLIRKIIKINIWDYLGNMMTVSLIGTFLLLPLLFLSKYFNFSPCVFLGNFMIVVGIMLLEHMRRCKLVKIGLLPSISWLAYRIFFLVLITYFL